VRELGGAGVINLDAKLKEVLSVVGDLNPAAKVGHGVLAWDGYAIVYPHTNPSIDEFRGIASTKTE
jgi:hypothetical protein